MKLEAANTPAYYGTDYGRKKFYKMDSRSILFSLKEILRMLLLNFRNKWNFPAP
jgi:hypothetical protein